VGVALGVGTSVVTDPRVQAQIAITMHRLIQQGTAPNLASRMAPILVMQMMREGGEAAAPEFQAPGPAAVTANRR
jgi:transcriptional regulator GlxA family with amidase domain